MGLEGWAGKHGSGCVPRVTPGISPLGNAALLTSARRRACRGGEAPLVPCNPRLLEIVISLSEQPWRELGPAQGGSGWLCAEVRGDFSILEVLGTPGRDGRADEWDWQGSVHPWREKKAKFGECAAASLLTQLQTREQRTAEQRGEIKTAKNNPALETRDPHPSFGLGTSCLECVWCVSSATSAPALAVIPSHCQRRALGTGTV